MTLKNGSKKNKKKLNPDIIRALKIHKEALSDISISLGITFDDVIKIISVYHLTAIHQHIEQLVYKYDTGCNSRK